MPSPRQQFDDDLADLRGRILEMGALAEEVMRDSIIALTRQDMALAATIIPRDDIIDAMEIEIEALCLRLLARPHPLTNDLRLIGNALKVITDIERIGDHGVDISRVAQHMTSEMLYKPLVDIPRMGTMAREMFHEALQAFVHRDMARVDRVLAADDAVDDLYARMRRELQETMQRDPHAVMQASHLLFVAHYIERICDHCCNIVERVAFMETGRIKGSISIKAAGGVPALSENNPAVGVGSGRE